MNRRLLASLLAFPFVLLGCAGNVPPPGELAASKTERITQAAPEADLASTVDGNTEFGLSVYRLLTPKGGNLVFSPYSISTALAMTYPGARGDTEKAFEKVLHVGLPQAQWHRAMNTLERELSSRGVGASGKDGHPFELSVNNQLFSQKGYHLETPFLDVLASEYGAGVRLLDFAGAAEPSRQAINSWVNTNTGSLIPELLVKGTITPDTRLALVNTLYFNAAWKKVFDKNLTAPGEFTTLDGSAKQVSMMAGESIVAGHAVVDGVDVLSLAYSGDEVSMLIVMPPAGKLGDLEGALTAAKLTTFAKAAAEKQGSMGVKMPKFDVRTQASLEEILKKLGLEIAFGGDADFSGMTGTRELSITAVVHEAVVKTDEAGTEAAAATAVVVGKLSVPEYFEVNRPFVYAVRDNATGAVLFMGRIVDP